MKAVDGVHISTTQLQLRGFGRLANYAKCISYESRHGATCSDITAIMIMNLKIIMANLDRVSATSL
jgi:hypothetical protein